ncbi:MAG: cytochrome c peroxidase, partial [Pseudomonadota bacterium]
MTVNRTILIASLLLPMFAAVQSAAAADPGFGALSTDDFPAATATEKEKYALGQLLFFDKILSGNRNISCATCHHPRHGSSDGLPLPLGEGPRGLGPERRVGATMSESVHARVPRNSPALFNLGATEVHTVFHDGRLSVDEQGIYNSGFVSPLGFQFPAGLDSVLAAQAMFPVTSAAEMAGDAGENPVADAVAQDNIAGPDGVWELLAQRLAGVPAYVSLFRAAYPDEVFTADDITYVRAANAIATFESHAFRTLNSPFDRHLRGEEGSLSDSEARGMALFYGEAGCSGCHSGKLQTDQDFHAIAMVQTGPGKGHGMDGSYRRATGFDVTLEDIGRGDVTGDQADNFRFRTPSLRNVALTGPWGHTGAYASLEAVVRHHLDPVAALEAFEPSDTKLPRLGRVVEVTGTGDAQIMEWLEKDRQVAF